MAQNHSTVGIWKSDDSEPSCANFELGRAGLLVITRDGDSSAATLVSEEQRAALPPEMAGYPSLMSRRTTAELEAEIHGGFHLWREFRDAVR